MDSISDLVVLGGGINGCGIAADAALRGLSVTLIEKDDIASKTSSSSSKLIHGGLRYLEYYDFSLVKKAIKERQILFEIAPHLVHPLLFVLPYQNKSRPLWLLKAGLFLYDNLSRKNKLPKSKFIKRQEHANFFSPLSSKIDKGFLFYDGFTNDARLTLANALQAKTHGASVLTHTELLKGETNSTSNLWNLTVKTKDGREKLIKARCVINATGPWVESTNLLLGLHNHYHLSLVKGSHLVVKQLYQGEHAYLLQNSDNRILFIMPYFGFTLIGTTDVSIDNTEDKATISVAEIDYLLNAANSYFNYSLTNNDIVSSWSGVRPLIAAEKELPQALSRDYFTHFSKSPAPNISIYGGKLTVYRQLAVDVVDQLRKVFPNLGPSLTHNTPLPGAVKNYDEFVSYAYKKYSMLDSTLLQRLLTTYGTEIERFIPDNLLKSGENFGYGLFQKEVDYLVDNEWALTSEDILWRRTKLGLLFQDADKKKLDQYLTR